MAYLAAELITNSFYTSGVISEELETPSANQMSRGLRLLNNLLSYETLNVRRIPYRLYSFTSTPNDGDYFINNLIAIQTLTYLIDGNVRFATQLKSRTQFWGEGRANNIQSLPFSYYPERVKGGMNVYLYFKPDKAYVINIYGKFGLESVTFDTDLEQTYDDFFIDYLEYALAQKICGAWNIEFQPENERMLQNYSSRLNYLYPLDGSMIKQSTLTSRRGSVWGQANLGKGFTAP